MCVFGPWPADGAWAGWSVCVFGPWPADGAWAGWIAYVFRPWSEDAQSGWAALSPSPADRPGSTDPLPTRIDCPITDLHHLMPGVWVSRSGALGATPYRTG